MRNQFIASLLMTATLGYTLTVFDGANFAQNMATAGHTLKSYCLYTGRVKTLALRRRLQYSLRYGVLS